MGCMLGNGASYRSGVNLRNVRATVELQYEREKCHGAILAASLATAGVHAQDPQVVGERATYFRNDILR